MSPLILLACTPFPCEDDEFLRNDGTCIPREGSESTVDSQDSSPPDSEEEPVNWQTLPEACSGSAGQDPLTLRSSVKRGQDEPGQGRFAEFIDVYYAPDTQIAWPVGQGGGIAVDVSDPDNAKDLGWLPEDAGHARYHRIEPIDETLYALSNRSGAVSVFDPREIGALEVKGETLIEGAEGLAVYDGHLFVSVRGQGINSYLPSSEELTAVDSVSGLDAPWDFSEVDEDGWTYVADNALGVVPVQLGSGGSATIHEAVDMDAATLHTELAGDYVYASLGAAGVAVLDRSDPSAPVEVARFTTGGSAVMAAFEGDRLWVADHESVLVYDVSDPTQPTPLAQDITEQFALAIDAHDGRAYVGDWNYLHVYELDESIQGVDLDVASAELLLSSEGGSTTTTLTNRGSGTLELQGATVSDERLSLQVSATSLAPGESAQLRLDFSGGDALEATVCLASNDGDSPETELSVTLGDDRLGQPAPDFVLQDIDGNTHTLSEQLGHPVLLAYFATW